MGKTVINTTDKTDFHAITIETLNDFIELASEYQTDYEVIEGALLDEYVFYDSNEWYNAPDHPEHIIVSSEYLTTWTSRLIARYTNDRSDAERFVALALEAYNEAVGE